METKPSTPHEGIENPTKCDVIAALYYVVCPRPDLNTVPSGLKTGNIRDVARAVLERRKREDTPTQQQQRQRRQEEE